MWAPLFFACSSSSITIKPAPSLRTNPSRSASNGLDAVLGSSFLVDIAFILQKPANASGLKNDTYGKMVMSKSKHSSKEVQQFLYNEKGVQALGKILGKTVKTA